MGRWRQTLLASGWLALILGGAASSAEPAYADGASIYAALRGQPDARLAIGGAAIDVTFADGGVGLDRQLVLDWVKASARAVTVYFGKFPVSRVGLLIVADDGGEVRTGTTFGYAGSAIRIHVGRRATAASLQHDWILVHEMTHLALPNIPRRSLWLQEGNATYVEPIARAQAGQLDAPSVWRWTLKGLASGQARPDAGGLDGTRDHDRIYWGGAAFWLRADIMIQQRTHGAMGLQTALRAINHRSGGNGVEWSVEQMLAVGDAATGGRELRDLYAELRDSAHPIDVPALFRDLGIALRGEEVLFDDSAPLAAIRRQITAPPS